MIIVFEHFLVFVDDAGPTAKSEESDLPAETFVCVCVCFDWT